MSRLPTKVQRYLHVLNQLKSPCFGQVLGVDAHTLLGKDSNSQFSLFQRGKDGQYIFRYEVPVQACVNPIDAEDRKAKVLPLSGLLAVFDELTTIAILNEDRNNRPGASTNLTAELSTYGLMNLPRARTTIDISVRVLKVGKMMGFAEAEAVSSGGEVIATGAHTKFLPNASYIQSLALGVFLPAIATVCKYTLYNTEQPSSLTLSKRKSVQDMVSAEGSMHAMKEFCNPTGVCHGGSQAMAMEQVAHRHLSKSISGSNRFPLLQSMSVSYLSAGKGEINFIAEEFPVMDSFKSIHVTASRRGDNRFPISKGVLHYIDIEKKNLSSRL